VIDPRSWTEVALEGGANLWSGVPCSYLKSLIDCVIAHPKLHYVASANEGDAVAIAAGAWLAGGLGVTLLQNSGLGNAVNPLTSLLQPFGIPMLLLVTWRGQPGGPPDEPQHELMGQITPQMLDLMNIPWELLPAEENAARECLQRQLAAIRLEERCRALLIPAGRFAAQPVTPPLPVLPLSAPAALGAAEPQATRAEMLQALLGSWGRDDLVVATTGYTGRELYALEDRPQHIYMVGAMGCASSVGLGLALGCPERRVWVLDGDGALLMRMGALATVGYFRPSNLVHVVLDNRCHESTGAQATVSASVDLCQVAAHCGYPQVLRWNDPRQVPAIGPGLAFVHAPILAGTRKDLPRPRETPAEVARRFRAAVQA
jgi:phosphonopyruvate decarboxylase